MFSARQRSSYCESCSVDGWPSGGRAGGGSCKLGALRDQPQHPSRHFLSCPPPPHPHTHTHTRTHKKQYSYERRRGVTWLAIVVLLSLWTAGVVNRATPFMP